MAERLRLTRLTKSTVCQSAYSQRKLDGDKIPSARTIQTLVQGGER